MRVLASLPIVLLASLASADTQSWNIDADGNYFDTANWTNATVPSGVADMAQFGGILTQPRTVTLDASVSLNKVIFDNAASYTLAGPANTLTLGGADHELNVVQGAHTIQPLVNSSTGITKTGVGIVSIRKLTSTGNVAINEGTLSLSGGLAVASKITSLSIADGAQLTVGQTPVIFTSPNTAPTLESLRLLVRDGKIGIGSPSNRVIGFADPLVARTVGGETANSGNVILRQTRLGDANVDLITNFDDLLVTAKNYNTTGRTWQNGDFNYDGVNNFDDLLIIAQNYNGAALTAGEITQLDPQFAEDFALAMSNVPEPAAMGVVLATGFLAGRKRK